MGVLWRRDYQLAGEDPAILSATTWIFRISTIADAFKALLAQNTVFVAEAYKDPDQAKHNIGHIARQGCLLAIAVSIPITTTLFFTNNILQDGLGIETNVAEHVSDYFVWSALGLPFALCNHMGERLLSAIDQEYLLLPYAVAHAIAGYLLNEHLITQYQAKGAGLSLLIQTFIRSMMLLMMAYHSPALQPFKLFSGAQSADTNRQCMKETLQEGASLFSAELITGIIQLCTSLYVAKLGTEYLHEEQAVSQWFLIPYLLAHPVGECANRLVAQMIGKKDIDAARQYGQAGLAIAVIAYLLTATTLTAYAKPLTLSYLNRQTNISNGSTWLGTNGWSNHSSLFAKGPGMTPLNLTGNPTSASNKNSGY